MNPLGPVRLVLFEGEKFPGTKKRVPGWWEQERRSNFDSFASHNHYSTLLALVGKVRSAPKPLRAIIIRLVSYALPRPARAREATVMSGVAARALILVSRIRCALHSTIGPPRH